MDDTIYRQAAIEAVIKRDANCGIDSAEVLRSLPSAQQWIPITPKTLPNKIGNYLVTTHNGQITIYIFTVGESSKEYWMCCAVAWMPLPEPYREEDSNE